MNIEHGVSVIIPAFNGAVTISSTLASLQQQTYADWEAIVVDDGSTDDTAAIVEEFDDHRVHLIRQRHRGVSAARNTGTAVARHPWVLYLDADDLLAPSYLRQAVTALRRRPSARFAVTAWARLALDGRLYDDVPPRYFDDLFDTSAQYCPFVIHACMARRDLVDAVGGWDERLTTCEDWDLWARVARTGADYVVAPGALAIYRTRPNSASFDGLRLLRDGITVLERTHAPDERVPLAGPRYLAGRDRSLLDERVIGHAAWCAGQLISFGRDARTLLDEVSDRRAPLIKPEQIAKTLEVSSGVGSMGRPLHERWSDQHKLFVAFLEDLEQLSGCPQLAARAELELARRAARQATTAVPLDLGPLRAISVDILRPLPRVDVPDEARRLHIRAVAGGSTIGCAEIAAPIDGVLRPEQLHAALVEQLASEIFRRCVAPLSRFAATMWGDGADNRDRSAPVPRHVAGECLVELATADADLAVARGVPLDVIVTFGGCPIRTFRIVPRRSLIPIQRIRATALRNSRPAMLRAAVSVGIVGRPHADAIMLRERLRSADTTAGDPEVQRVLVPLAPSWSLPWPDIRSGAAQRVRRAADRLNPRQRHLAKRAHRLLRTVPVPRAGRIPILMYHRVAPAGAAATSRWRVDPRLLDEHLDALHRAGYTAISLAMLGAILFDGAPRPRRPVVLSFDDGYSDFAEHAWPRLRARGHAATVFVVAGAAGGTNVWDDVFDDPAPLMDWATLRGLVAEGVDLGSHSLDHPMLSSLTASDVAAQVNESRRLIEHHTSAQVESFAYPYGDVDEVVADSVGRAGYRLAVTCELGAVTASSQPLRLPRIEVTGTTSGADLLSRLRRSRS